MTAKLSAEELERLEQLALNAGITEHSSVGIERATLIRLLNQVREAEALKAWQPIETAPRDADAHFWIVPKAPDETYSDTSGRPITADFEPYRHFGRYGQWPSLAKAILWYPAPPPPAHLEKERTA